MNCTYVLHDNCINAERATCLTIFSRSSSCVKDDDFDGDISLYAVLIEKLHHLWQSHACE